MTDRVEEFIQATLAPLGYPVSQTPGNAKAETWLTWNTVNGREYLAGNDPTRIRHTFQVHAWTHGVGSEHRQAFFSAIDALKAAGVRVFSWGMDEREPDTGICHIACTCMWNQHD